MYFSDLQIILQIINEKERKETERCGVGNKLTHTKIYRFNNQPVDEGRKFGSPYQFKPTTCLWKKIFLNKEHKILFQTQYYHHLPQTHGYFEV